MTNVHLDYSSNPGVLFFFIISVYYSVKISQILTFKMTIFLDVSLRNDKIYNHAHKSNYDNTRLENNDAFTTDTTACSVVCDATLQ